MVRLQAPLPDRYTLATPDELDTRIATAKAALGDRLLILGHHYQRDEVIKWADARGDSFKLARFAADNHQATDIVFCGVHFMAESADVLTGQHQRVVLPDLNAGCSMADMADIDQVEECWDDLAAVTDVDRVVPVTYMNSSAALKAFVGEHGGAVCTSSNARAVLEWALAKGAAGEITRRTAGEITRRTAGEIKVLFFPDQHLGRNTAYNMGYTEDAMRVWNPRFELGGLEERDVKETSFLLWKGHCSVHQRFRPEHVAGFRAQHPDGEVIVHPECAHDVVELADRVGSTERILAWVEDAPSGSVLGVGTEIHMVQRMAREHPDLTVVSLDPLICPCSTMFRIDGPHLAWVLDALVDGVVVNQISVDERTAEWARVALQRMLDIT
ncbi:MAG TPA: quinolinate synthase [Acidimicrobiia bacterium]|nr:quinolinate synthase [Acidimicrobiia bacterium]